MKKSKFEIALNALKNIADPISYLRAEAKRMGERLDGRGAVEFANNGNSLSKMAEDALRDIENTTEPEITEKFKGTPGQWRVESDEWGDYIVSDDPNPPHHGTVICGMDNENQEIERDARLIAAAPELLEALQKVVRFHKAGLHLSDPLIKYVYPAINKALGINE